MDQNIPSAVIETTTKPNAGVWFTRYNLTLADSTEFNFTDNPADIEILGTLYYFLPCVLSAEVRDTGNKIPSRQLQISNAKVAQFYSPYIEQKNGLRNATLVVTPVSYANPTADMSSKGNTYTVSHCQPGVKSIVVHLGCPRLKNKSLPLDIYRDNRCSWYKPRDFKGPKCKYAGAATSCDGLLATCRSLGNETNFGAQTNLKKNRVKLA